MVDVEWNGLPARARKVWARVAEAPQFPAYWAKPFIGWERAAVEVHYDQAIFYLDDEEDQGWLKVTHGGLPSYGSKSLEVSDVRAR